MNDSPSRKSRTYSVEEVGEIIHQASSEKGSRPEAGAPAPGSQHERVTWDELCEIAADVGISEESLERVTEASVAAKEEVPVEEKGLAPASPSTELAQAGRTLTRDVAITCGGVLVVGGAGMAAGLGTALLWPMMVLAPVALVARSVWLFAPSVAGLARGRPERDLTAAASGKQYRVIFGEGVVDLTTVEPEGPTEVVDVQVHFGEVLIRMNPAVPYLIETSVAFGEVKVPQASSLDRGQSPRLIVRVKVRFGAARIKLVSPRG